MRISDWSSDVCSSDLEHSTSRLTLSSAGGVMSDLIRMKWLPPRNSSRLLTASLCRNSDLGVMRMSGLRNARRIWRRRTWKYLAGDVMLQAWILSTAHNCRNRMRQFGRANVRTQDMND